MKKIKAIWELMRLEHGVMIALGILVGSLVALKGSGFPSFDKFMLTFFTALFLEASTFALNDYYDLEIDRKNNRIDRPLVRGDLQPKSAIILFFIFFPLGLILALGLAIFTGIVFAAPGAVMFMGGSRHHETGKIAIAGPLSNIIIAYISFPLFYFIFFETQFGALFGFICLINALLAFFNLLPFGPLDGLKVVKWNATVWLLLFIPAIFMLIVLWQRFTPIFY